MSKESRNGNSRLRRSSFETRVPDLGYYVIVTDTEGTERCYFEGLRTSLPERLRSRLVIKVIQTDTADLISAVMKEIKYDPQYRCPWIVFDRDRVVNFDGIIEEARQSNVDVGWSNPCFEIWLFAYYGKMPTIEESWICCRDFGNAFQQKTGCTYDKNDSAIYKKLTREGDEDKAITIAKTRYESTLKNGTSIPSKMNSCSTVYRLVQEIRGKTKNKE